MHVFHQFLTFYIFHRITVGINHRDQVGDIVRICWNVVSDIQHCSNTPVPVPDDIQHDGPQLSVGSCSSSSQHLSSLISLPACQHLSIWQDKRIPVILPSKPSFLDLANEFNNYNCNVVTSLDFLVFIHRKIIMWPNYSPIISQQSEIICVSRIFRDRLAEISVSYESEIFSLRAVITMINLYINVIRKHFTCRSPEVDLILSIISKFWNHKGAVKSSEFWSARKKSFLFCWYSVVGDRTVR